MPLSYRVERMRLAKDEQALVVNDSLTLGCIPPAVFEYRLGNRSALDWVVDQYQVSEDKRSGIRSDPNRRTILSTSSVSSARSCVRASKQSKLSTACRPSLAVASNYGYGCLRYVRSCSTPSTIASICR